MWERIARGRRRVPSRTVVSTHIVSFTESTTSPTRSPAWWLGSPGSNSMTTTPSLRLPQFASVIPKPAPCTGAAGRTKWVPSSAESPAAVIPRSRSIGSSSIRSSYLKPAERPGMIRISAVCEVVVEEVVTVEVWRWWRWRWWRRRQWRRVTFVPTRNWCFEPRSMKRSLRFFERSSSSLLR